MFSDNFLKPRTLHGFKVLISEPIRVVTHVNLTWKERLHSKPFKPLITTKEVITWKPAAMSENDVLHHSDGLHMTIKTFERLERIEQLKNGKIKIGTQDVLEII